jgi:hypothetical protein
MKSSVILGSSLILGILLSACDKKSDDLYVYDLEELRHVPPELIQWESVSQKKIELENLHGIAAGYRDYSYISGDKKILVLDGSDDQVMQVELEDEATALAVDRDGTLYLGIGNYVAVYENSGASRGRWADLGSDSIITSISVGEQEIYVADAGSRQVFVFAKSGKLISIVDGRDERKEVQGFIVPSPYFDTSLDQDQNLWVVNPGLHTLEKYSRAGRFLELWRKSPVGIEGFSGCCNPVHIAIFPDGTFVTSEKGLQRVKLHGRTGEFLHVVASSKAFTKRSDVLDLAIDSEGRIVVLDLKAGVLQRFARKTEMSGGL